MQLVHGEVHAWHGLASPDTELGVGVVRDEAEGDGFADKGTESAVVCLDGIVGKGTACLDSDMVLKIIVEAVDVGKGDVLECVYPSEEMEYVDEEEILSLGGGRASFFFGALAAIVDEGCLGFFYLPIAEHG